MDRDVKICNKSLILNKKLLESHYTKNHVFIQEHILHHLECAGEFFDQPVE